MPNVCLAYKPYVGIRTQFLSLLKNNCVLRRMPAYATVLQTYTTYAKRTPSVCQRMSDIFHTLAYASTIRYSVTGPFI